MKLRLPLILATLFLSPNAYAQACNATGNDLSLAKDSYAVLCPNTPRADCDPIGGGQWSCSSAVIGYASPARAAENPVDDPAPEVTLPETTSSECTATGSSLNLAITAYEASCMAPRIDCDPIAGGWSCSSGVLGVNAPTSIVNSTPTVETPLVEGEAPVEVVNPAAPVTARYTGPAPQLSWADSYSVNGVCYIDGGHDHNARNMLWTIDGVTRTVGEWIPLLKTGPGRGNNRIYNDVQCGHGPANDAGDEDAYPAGCPGLIIVGSREGCNVKGPRWQLK